MAKRFLTSVLIILFLGRIIGYFPVFKIEQYTIRREIKTMLKSAIPDSELKVFSFPVESKDAKKYGEKHEFELRGQMYDVVRKVRENGILKLYCFHDKEETDLFNKLDRMVKDRMNTSDHPFRRVVNIFAKTFHYINPAHSGGLFANEDLLNSHLFNYSNAYSFDYVRKFVPPPRFPF